MSKRKERMRARVSEGRTPFILKEGLYHFGIKLWFLYILVTFIVSYRLDFTSFVESGEFIRSALYLLIFLAIGAYWGFIWFHVHSAEKKQEEEKKAKDAEERNKKKK